MSSLGIYALALPQESLDLQVERSLSEWAEIIWVEGGFMMYPLAAAFALGLGIIVWKLIDLGITGARTRKVLREADQLISEARLGEALEVARESNSPAGRVLAAGLERRDEGTDRVMKTIENIGMIEMAGLERGLVWLATVTNVAPLLGFLGTVIGMILAFQAIELAGEVDATTVAGGIKVALITTASGLAIAIPISIAHNYFVTRVDRLVLDMEESAQKMIDAIHDMEGASAAR